MSWRPSNLSSSTAPELRVVLRLEQDVQAYLSADTFEDEQRGFVFGLAAPVRSRDWSRCSSS